ncbi:MAG: hypothetical protein IID16_08340 [Candidatus Marinimicrobia bacterium]|nr:hypothetical protein [Candidatus Neomarinimicrobiota bacterium]
MVNGNPGTVIRQLTDGAGKTATDPEISGGVLFQPDQTQFLPPEHDAIPAYEKCGCCIPACLQTGETAEEICLRTVTILDDPNFKNLSFTKPESVNHVCKDVMRIQIVL